MGLLTCFGVALLLKTRSGSLSPTHSLLFSALFFSPATYEVLTSPHSLAFACLALVIFLAFSFPFFLNLPSPFLQKFTTTLLFLLLLFQTTTLYVSSVLLPIHPFSLLPFFSSFDPSLFLCIILFSLISLQEVARSANMVFARRSSADVFLPDRPGQPTATSSPQASPPTYPQSVSPLNKELKSTEGGRAYNIM